MLTVSGLEPWQTINDLLRLDVHVSGCLDSPCTVLCKRLRHLYKLFKAVFFSVFLLPKLTVKTVKQ